MAREVQVELEGYTALAAGERTQGYGWAVDMHFLDFMTRWLRDIWVVPRDYR